MLDFEVRYIFVTRTSAKTRAGSMIVRGVDVADAKRKAIDLLSGEEYDYFRVQGLVERPGDQRQGTLVT